MKGICFKHVMSGVSSCVTAGLSPMSCYSKLHLCLREDVLIWLHTRQKHVTLPFWASLRNTRQHVTTQDDTQRENRTLNATKMFSFIVQSAPQGINTNANKARFIAFQLIKSGVAHSALPLFAEKLEGENEHETELQTLV